MPIAPNEKTFETIVASLKKHIQPDPHIVMERYRFGQRVQSEGESVANYVAALRALAVHCGFKCPNAKCATDTTEVHLQTQFILGVRDPETKEALLQQPKDTSFQQSVDLALSIKSAKKETEHMRKSAAGNQLAINQVQHGNKRPRFNPQKQSNGADQFNSQPGTNQKNVKNQPNIFAKCGIGKSQCLRCGRDDHNSDKCKVSPNVVCRFCSAKGHIEKICSKKRLQSTSKSKINAITAELPVIHSLDSISINQIGEPTDLWKKVNVNVTVKNIVFEFKLDLGSPVTVIPLRMFMKYLPHK